jgi:hypothetical protein
MRWAILLLVIFSSACSEEDPLTPGDGGIDAGAAARDARPNDAAPSDATNDAALADAITFPDAAPPDTGADAGIETRVWREAEKVELPDTEIARGPSIELFENKEAVAVWYQVDFDSNSNTDIWGNRWIPETRWAVAEKIDGLLGPPSEALVLAADPAGFAISAWTQFINGNYFTYANIYAPSVGDFALTLPIYGTYQGALRPQVAIDADGAARITFEDESGTNVWMASSRENVWVEATSIDGEELGVSEVALSMELLAWVRGGTDLVESTGSGVMVIDDTHEAVVAVRASRDQLLYQTKDADGDRLIARPGTIVTVAPAGAIDSQSLIFKVGARGDAIVAWKEGAELKAAVRVAGGLFQPSELLASEGAQPSSLAVDPLGHAILLFEKADESVCARRYFGGVWSDEFQVSAALMIGLDAHVSIDPSGDAMAIWSERDPLLLIASIWSRRYE